MGRRYCLEKVSVLYPDFEFIKRATLSGTKEEKIETIKKYYKDGYYMVVSVDTTGGSVTDHWVSVRTIDYDTNTIYIMDTGGKNYTELSRYSITGNIVLFKAPRPIGWRDNNPPYNYEELPTGIYYLKNCFTDTYIGLSEDNTISFGEKEESDTFKMKITGDSSSGYYISHVSNAEYVLTPYFECDETYINFAERKSDKTQNWNFRKIGNEYMIYNAYDESLVLTADGTELTLKTVESSENQIWTIEREYDLVSISITKEPTTLVYEDGNKYFSSSGMVVNAEYSDGTTRDIVGYAVSYDFSTLGETDVIVSYTENNITKTAVQVVTIQDIFEGKGTKKDPYRINNSEDFNTLRAQINNVSSTNTVHYSFLIIMKLSKT